MSLRNDEAGASQRLFRGLREQGLDFATYFRTSTERTPPAGVPRGGWVGRQ